MKKSSVLSADHGPQAATVAMDQEAIRIFLRGESDDPAQILERMEERLTAELAEELGKGR
ncbi:MAG: hypothetical protein KGJ31_02410 [Patescibacteria group bacterium]|nr:hypothetical protein [Patescibacteria group bacterium]